MQHFIILLINSSVTYSRYYETRGPALDYATSHTKRERESYYRAGNLMFDLCVNITGSCFSIGL